MIKLYSPQDEIELAILKSVFQAEGIPIFVHNDNYGSLRPGMQIELLNTKTIMVHESYLEAAESTLRNYLGNIANADTGSGKNESDYSFWDKARMVLEGLMFGWVMPGKRWPKSRNK